MEGMGHIVASVSGYHGSERCKLIKLISLSGASYVGNMSRSTTHLVCWKFEGEKYKLAKKFGTIIVNHRWFEDCMKEGKRVSEQPYTRLSGHQVGSVILDDSDFSELGVLRENKLVLTGRYKSRPDSVDTEHENTEHQDWDDRWLLEKNEEPSRIVSKPLRKQKKRVCDGNRCTISSDPPRTSRRLVKMSANKYPLESHTGNGKECVTNKILICDQNVASTSNHYSLRNKNEAKISGRTEDASTSRRRARNHWLSDEEEDVVEMLDTHATCSILETEKRVTAPERAIQDISFDAENIKELKNMDPDESAGSPTSLALSCVICHTEFSSTRGVLPCGHRFCFLCIQKWADFMASKGKTSTCPLCKSAFMTITKVDNSDCADQKIYSQTVPCPLSTQDIFLLPDGPSSIGNMQVPSELTCCQCNFREPEDLLIQCNVCHVRCIHCYCLDPPLYPWMCSGCKDTRVLYPRF